MKTQILAAALVSALVLATPAAEAKIYLSRVNTAVTELTPTIMDVPLALGQTSAQFVLAARTRVAITFSSECHARDGTGFVSINIVVDGIEIAPARGLDLGWCSHLDGFAAASTTVSVGLAAGTHIVRVRAILGGSTTSGALDDSSLVVFD